MDPNAPAIVNHENKPWPMHFLVRKKGQIVPLIAVDELPPSLQIEGVPRYLAVVETKGMLNLGLQGGGEGYCCVTRDEAKVMEEKEKGRNLLDSNHNPAKLRNETIKPTPTTPTSSETSPAMMTPKQPPNTPKSSSASPSPLPAILEKPLHQQLCRHWCIYGICKWGQTCHYRHHMPMNLVGLQEVGLKDWPVWFRRTNPGMFLGDSVSKRGARRAGCGLVVGGAVDVLERKERARKESELGEQILARLRRLEGMEWEFERANGEGRGNEKEKSGRKVKGRGAVKAPPVVEKVERSERSKGLDDIILMKKTRRWEDDESGNDSDISSLPPIRRGVESRESEVGRKDKLIDV